MRTTCASMLPLFEVVDCGEPWCADPKIPLPAEVPATGSSGPPEVGFVSFARALFVGEGALGPLLSLLTEEEVEADAASLLASVLFIFELLAAEVGAATTWTIGSTLILEPLPLPPLLAFLGPC